MADKTNPEQDSSKTSFRTMRRRSRPGSSYQDVTNVFGDPDASDEAPALAPEPGPAHVEAETRKFGQVRMISAPNDCPAALSDALVAKIDNIGRFCDRALLFQAEYDGGEGALMVCFSDVEPQDVARIEGAIADALMASGHDDHALGILFLASQSSALEPIERVAQDLRAGT